MDYGEVLGRAWRIIWKHKVLWIFGILAGCARGGGGGGGGGAGGSGGGSGGANPPFGQNPGPEFQQFMSTASEWIANHLLVVVALVLFVLLLVVLSIFLGTIGRVGLIRGTFKADGGEERLGFGDLFRGSLPFFWRVFGLSFLFWLAFLIILLPAIALGVLTAGVGFLCILPLICILVPLAWIGGIVVQQADSAMVIEDLGLAEGVRRGWSVLKNNIGPMLIIWLITLVVGFVVAIVIALPLLIVVVPAAIAFAMSGNTPAVAPLLIGGLCLAVYLPIMLVLNGILTAYLQSVWTLTYLRLTRPKEGEANPPALPANA